MKNLGHKIFLTEDKVPPLNPEIACIITFKKEHLASELASYRPAIFIDSKNGYRRIYHNFPIMEREMSKQIYQTLMNPSTLSDHFYRPASFALNYYHHKLFHFSSPKISNLSSLIREVKAIMKTNYAYYSIATSILISLFFTKTGLPSEYPQILEFIYGTDLFDDIFFPIAFIFTTFEFTSDLLLSDKMKDHLSICKAFISYLLWRGAKWQLRRLIERFFPTDFRSSLYGLSCSI
ncbi:MAG: hypothetical protein QW518_05960 [Thermofilaceae archaeon]